MHKLLVIALLGLTAGAQTKIDLATQAKRVDFSNASSTSPLQTGTSLPATCVVGQMFFNTGAPAGANLYACTATNNWSMQGGITGSNCWADATSRTLRCQDPNGNSYSVVVTATSGTANQWVDYIGPDGTPHTSQPTAAAVGAVADPGNNGVPYRSGAGASTAANADQMSGPFFCQDAGTPNAFGCSLTPPITTYTAGTTYWFRANSANSGVATLNLNGLGPKTVVKQANQPLAANDIRAGQWVMVTYDGANMQMQSQSGNTPSISAAQLPAVTMRTDQGNVVTTGTQDFSQAAHTLPMKSGITAAMPTACSVGEGYFATDATAGSNMYGCTAVNVWTPQAGSSNLTVKASGTAAGSRNMINIIPGVGIAPMVSDTGSQINIQIPIDTAVTDTRLNAASGADLLVTTASNSGTAYVGCPAGITPPLTAGMVAHLAPDHNSTGGAATFNYCGTGAIALMEADGLTNLTATDLASGRQIDIWYDGTNNKWRLKVPTSSGSAVSTVFGRGGAVAAASGDYTASQVTNAVSTLGSYTDPSWLTLTASGGRISGYQPTLTTGITSQYFRGDLSLGTFPTTWAWASLTGVPTLTNTVFGRSGTVAATSGDYTAAQVTNAFDVTAANALNNTTAPGTPAPGKASIWVDSTDKVLKAKNDAGTVSITVVPDSGASNNFLTAISPAGAIGKARPSCSSLSDSGTGCTAVLAAVATSGSAADLSTGALNIARLPVLPEVKYVPAANCSNATAGNGWSIGSGGTVACRAGANNQGGYISITDTSSTFAQFQVAIPEDWAGGSNYPYIRFHLASADTTNGHTIIPQIRVSCARGDGSTTDDVAFNAAHAASAITLNTTGNQFWNTSTVQMNSTDFAGCTAGSLMMVQVGRAADTATSAYFYGASITFPRIFTMQAN